MIELKPCLVDKIVNQCINTFNKLNKTGKPVANEWTVLSCIIEHNLKTNSNRVISLGTGSKCIGATNMSPSGKILNDSHAEIIARKGFLLYLYENLEKCMTNEDSIFTKEKSKYTLNDDINYIFYSSQLPCGDASIVPKEVDSDNHGDLLAELKRKLVCETDIDQKRIKTEDIHRTGAKCLPNSSQDMRESGVNYHTVGLVRTKPGRGDKTLSVSCSDKIAKWIHMGIQGRLLDLLLNRGIHIKHYIIGAEVPYSKEVLERALLHRNTSMLPDDTPYFYQTTVKFDHLKNYTNTRAAPGSIVWCSTDNLIHEVSILGRKLGTTKKNQNAIANSLSICKYNLYKRFLEVVSKDENLKTILLGSVSVDKVPYNEMKNKSENYMKKWLLVKEKLFKIWTVKPDMWNFCIEFDNNR